MRLGQIFIAVGLLAATLVACGGPKFTPRETNLPISSEARLVEIVSACELMILAAGIGEGEEKHLDSLASMDARKSAVLFALTGGTDPILQTKAERNRFGFIEENFFAGENFRKYISFEQSDYHRRIFIDGKAKLKVERNFKINRCILARYLADQSVVEPPEEEALGMPQIAVIPASFNGEDPVASLNADPNLYHAGTVIESHLTTLGYDAVLLSQSRQIDELVTYSKYLKEAQADNAYIAASTMGTDIYITFTVAIDYVQDAGQQIPKATTTVKAFETTTGRLLGSETGYSSTKMDNTYVTTDLVAIEAAMNDGVGKVLSRIQSYWKKDMRRGIQYKMHFVMNPGLSTNAKEEAKFAIYRTLKEIAKTIKPKISTENNFDYLIWVDPDQVSDFVDLQMQFKSVLRMEMPSINMSEMVSNMKLVIYEFK